MDSKMFNDLRGGYVIEDEVTGKKEAHEHFRSGSEFEYFVMGVSSGPEEYEKHLRRVFAEDEKALQKFRIDSKIGQGALDKPVVTRRRLGFLQAREEAIAWAVEHQLDNVGIENNPDRSTILAWKLWQEVYSRVRPSRRADVHMYCVPGTAFDFDYHADMFFSLKCAMVKIDLTINMNKKLFHEDAVDPYHLVFRNTDIEVRPLAKFAAKVAKLLQDPENNSFCGIRESR